MKKIYHYLIKKTSKDGDWHIDHKYPVSKYDSKTPMSIVNSLDNLQFLWASDNLSKGNKIKEGKEDMKRNA